MWLVEAQSHGHTAKSRDNGSLRAKWLSGLQLFCFLSHHKINAHLNDLKPAA